MQAFGTKDVIGFVNCDAVSSFKRSSQLNIEVSNFFGKVGKRPLITLLYCTDEATAALVQNTIALIPVV